MANILLRRILVFLGYGRSVVAYLIFEVSYACNL